LAPTPPAAFLGACSQPREAAPPDELRRRCQPGAPPPDERLRAVEAQLVRLSSAVADLEVEARRHSDRYRLNVLDQGTAAGSLAHLEEDLQKLREELRAESRARETAVMRLATLAEGEVRLREDATAREGQLREALGSELVKMGEVMRGELQSAAARSQELSDAFARAREYWAGEVNVQHRDLDELRGDVVALRDELRQEANRAQRLELRQEALAPMSSPSRGHADEAGGYRRLGDSVDSKATAAREEVLLTAVEEALREERSWLERVQQDMERRLQAQLEAAMSEVRAASGGSGTGEVGSPASRPQGLTRQKRLSGQAIEQSIKEREETCHMLLTYLEERVDEFSPSSPSAYKG